MRKLVTLLLALAMLATVMALPAVAETAEPITVSVLIGDPREQPTSDNRMFKDIEETFGLKFEFDPTAGGEIDQKLGTIIASQDYPDLMDGGNSAERLIEAGALINLMEYISPEKTPNIYTHLEPHLDYLLDDAGALYIIPNFGRQYNGSAYALPYVNGPSYFLQLKVIDWAGYPTIKTLDEYFDVIERYVAANPTDENGNPNTGFAILCDDWRAFCLFNPVQHLMGRPNDGDVIVDINNNFKVDSFIIQDYAKPYYKKLNEMYHKGLIDQDTFVMNYDQYIAKLSSGTVVGMFDQTWNFNDATNALRSAKMFDCTYQGVPIVYDSKYVDGKEIEEHYLNGTVINKNRGMGISTACKDPQRMVNFFEAMLSDEWQKKIMWGYEGVDYSIDENGRFVRTAKQMADSRDTIWRNANTARILTESLAHKQGRMDDGNMWDPEAQPECYYASLSEYEVNFLKNYKIAAPIDLFNDPIELAPYGEAWQISTEVNQDANDAHQALQDNERKLLPGIIMAADDAEFDKLWDEFVQTINDIPVSNFIDFMQEQVNLLVEKNSKE